MKKHGRTKPIYSGFKISKELTKKFGTTGKPIQIKMKFVNEIGNFIKRVESAQQAAARSELVFKLMEA